MGTNYYVHVNECPCCNRHDELHVGKSGTHVQAYVQASEWDTPPTPIGDIRSWADWKRLLTEIPHTCWNEYGDQLTDEKLIATFEGSPPEARRRGFDWWQEELAKPSTYWDPKRRDENWLDDDGFTMSIGEWS